MITRNSQSIWFACLLICINWVCVHAPQVPPEVHPFCKAWMTFAFPVYIMMLQLVGVLYTHMQTLANQFLVAKSEHCHAYLVDWITCILYYQMLCMIKSRFAFEIPQEAVPCLTSDAVGIQSFT